MRYRDRYDSLLEYYWEECVGDAVGDWHLAKCQMLAESNANPNAKSSAGAVGLFQLMPETASGLGIFLRSDPEQSIKGGITYFGRMWNMFKLETGLERIKFALAAYNAGAANIIKAQNLATQRGLDKSKWVSIVQVLSDITGPSNSQQTEQYVSKIMVEYALSGRVA